MGVKNMVGYKFGRLQVIARAGNDKRGEAKWLCNCKCGGQTITTGSNLRTGHTTSCGCNKNKAIHSGCGTPEYKCWQAMKDRCENPSAINYQNYGGRGIKICSRWRDNFAAFYEDMGVRPSAEYSIDRINVNGDYRPGNCRWATKETQNQNQRVQRRSKTGVTGVRKVGRRFKVGIQAKGKYYNLGYYATLEEAAVARRAAENKYWGVVPNDV